ncbi:MAG: hypothetical protein IJ680_06570, partial [Paludibacteraceae bacterium]|nr:hypothetical protein [Paludibacteraceae bacterium]
MPYRRLPNTDQARLKALQTAIKKADENGFSEKAISFATLNEARSFLAHFEKQMMQYQQIVDKKVNANKHYRQIAANAHMYVSHFIQVLNLAVIRGEIKREQKSLYHLSPHSNRLPDISNDRDLLKWGKNIIEGENERLKQGGMPIYNPTIQKVKVHYDIFREYQSTQELYKSNTNRNWTELDRLRQRADKIILDIWNQVEEYYKDLRPYARL